MGAVERAEVERCWWWFEGGDEGEQNIGEVTHACKTKKSITVVLVVCLVKR